MGFYGSLFVEPDMRVVIPGASVNKFIAAWMIHDISLSWDQRAFFHQESTWHIFCQDFLNLFVDVSACSLIAGDRPFYKQLIEFGVGVFTEVDAAAGLQNAGTLRRYQDPDNRRGWSGQSCGRTILFRRMPGHP